MVVLGERRLDVVFQRVVSFGSSFTFLLKFPLSPYFHPDSDGGVRAPGPDQERVKISHSGESKTPWYYESWSRSPRSGTGSLYLHLGRLSRQWGDVDFQVL